MSDIAGQIRAEAHRLGFSNLGIVPALPSVRLNAFLRWLRAGMHGEMAYLARADRVARRQDLNQILPGAKSLLIAALDYYSLRLRPEIAGNPLRGRISNYAWNADYHDVMFKKLEDLASYIHAVAREDVQLRAYVDTGAILERDHGERGGLGFVGKNTMLIHPAHGSFFFLGEILTSADLPFDKPMQMPGCGSCTRCIQACPTSAFPTPYVLDARRCISYLMIELKGTIPPPMRPLMGNWIYGCDVCQDVCPWQRFAEPIIERHFAMATLERAAPLLRGLLSLSEEDFHKQYQGTPIARIGRARLVRNACVAAGNSRASEFGPQLTRLLEDQSELVRGHAAWALGEIHFGRTELYSALQAEMADQVRLEITTALERF